ncbi:type II toxin-antitoxin system HicB family antitoxin [Pantanalinema sp. GBBB05]|uniref:type II toxin-antitoxin system HicB family antitoxin n=1 Tax=Pantanalinema sp. GBBB05 TaxID=2604139 RepID=UPI001D8ABA7A|nr:type II toxin-antitoxin system HicB family antitoxin [Pantanalinema sp. GBBB05]
MNKTIELEQEEDGRWIAEVLELPGVLAYGASEQEAIANVQALAAIVEVPQNQLPSSENHDPKGTIKTDGE